MSSSFPDYSWPPTETNEHTALAGDRRDIEALKRRGRKTYTRPLPTFRAMLNQHYVSVGDDNQTEVEWDWWEFDDETVYTEETITAGFLHTWRVAAPGLYHVHATCQWQVTSAWTTTFILNTPFRNYVQSHRFTGNAFDDWYSFDVLVDLYPFDPYEQFFDADTPPPSIEMLLQMNQDSGVARNISWADLVIVRLGDVDVTTPTHDIGSPWTEGRVIHGGP